MASGENGEQMLMGTEFPLEAIKCPEIDYGDGC